MLQPLNMLCNFCDATCIPKREVLQITLPTQQQVGGVTRYTAEPQACDHKGRDMHKRLSAPKWRIWDTLYSI